MCALRMDDHPIDNTGLPVSGGRHASPASDLPNWLSLLSNPTQPGWNTAIAEAFTRTRFDEDNATSLNFIALATRILPPPEEMKLISVAALAANLAMRPQDFHYHNPHHSREVLALTIAQLAHHVASGKQPTLTGDTIWQTIAAAVDHDNGYTGGGNRVMGAHVPMHLEEQAAQTLRWAARYEPFLADVPDYHFDRIAAIIMPTDITGPHAESPGARLSATFNDPAFQPLYPHEKLFAQDPALLECARILSDADLGGSAGLDYRFALARTDEVMAEIGAKSGNGAFLYFMQNVAGDFPHSQAGRNLFGATRQRLLQTAMAQSPAPHA